MNIFNSETVTVEMYSVTYIQNIQDNGYTMVSRTFFTVLSVATQNKYGESFCSSIFELLNLSNRNQDAEVPLLLLSACHDIFLLTILVLFSTIHDSIVLVSSIPCSCINCPPNSIVRFGSVILQLLSSCLLLLWMLFVFTAE